MGRKEVLAERRALEEYYYSCKLETPEEVAKFFEVYTRLIWIYHQAGLVYDYYCDSTTVNKEGSEKMVGGVPMTEQHTIPALSPYPEDQYDFFNITCTGNKEDGYRFGQILTKRGVYARDGFTSSGMGDGSTYKGGDQWSFCECFVNKVNGRWVITDEFLSYGNEVTRRRVASSRPFYKTVLDGCAEQAEEKALEEAEAEKMSLDN